MQALSFSMQNDLLTTFFYHTTYLSNHKIISLPFYVNSYAKSTRIAIAPALHRQAVNLLLDKENADVDSTAF
jgi:hypothetical protein